MKYRNLLFINIVIVIAIIILIGLSIFLGKRDSSTTFRDNAEKYCQIEGGTPVIYPISKDSREETIGCQFDISPIYKK